MASKLSDLLQEKDSGMGRTIKLCRLLSCWGEIAGEKISGKTEAVKIKGEVLYVKASTPAWAQELAFLKQEFINKFNLVAGEGTITDIRFSAGG